MSDGTLNDLPRLGEEALGPCAICDRVMLATGLPLFLRLKVRRCGVDMKEVRRHVGLAAAIGGGNAALGLPLASIMGPGVSPVVVLDDWAEANVCTECAGKATVEMLTWKLMARAECAAEAEEAA